MLTLKKHAKDGFTLMEIMIVLAIMGMLAAMVGRLFQGQREKAKIQTTKTSLRTIKGTIDAYEIDTNSYPDTLKDLVRKPQNPEISPNWFGPYIKGRDVPKDAWGKKFKYRRTPEQDAPYPYTLHSDGSNKKDKSGRIDAWKI